jgi:uncharacterized protein YkwD
MELMRISQASIILLTLFASLGLAQTASFAQPAKDPYAHAVPPVSNKVYNAISGIPDSRIELLEQAVFDRTNAIRAENNVAPLIKNDLLQAVARSHSQDMAIHHYFGHDTGPLADGPMDRAHMAGVCGVAKDCEMDSENLSNTGMQNAAGALILFGSDNDVATMLGYTVDNPNFGFMSDAGHRGNILDNRTEQMAVGIALSDNGTLYVTQDFIRVTSVPPTP